jgi:copper(I)-binding protein
MRFHILASTCALVAMPVLLGGCTMPLAAVPAAQTVQPIANEITVVGAMARPAPLEGGTGAIYLTILNGLPEEVRLVSASSPLAAVTELHETVNDEGVMRMIPQPDGFTIPAGESVELAPGGKHIMLIDLVHPLLAGEEIPLTLSFRPSVLLTLTVPVGEMDGAMGDEAAAHDHSAATEDEAAAHDHSAATEDEAAHDHSAATEDEAAAHDHSAVEDTTDPHHADAALAALIEALPVASVHGLDDSLSKGEIPDYAESTMETLLETLVDGAWPEVMQAEITGIRAHAEELKAALQAGDLATAQPLAAELHDLLHALEHSAGGH